MKLIGKIFASIYSSFFTIILTGFLSLFFMQGVLSKDFIATTLKSLNFSEITVKEFGLDEYVQKYGENATVEDAIVAELKNSGVDEEKVRKILNDENIKDFIAKKVNEIIDSAALEKDVSLVTESEIKDALRNLELTDNDYKEITNFLNEVITDFNKEVKDGSSI